MHKKVDWVIYHNFHAYNICMQYVSLKRLFPFSYLYPKNAKDDEECTTDEDNVANGFEGGDEGLHHQLQTWSSANHPEERSNRKI